MHLVIINYVLCKLEIYELLKIFMHRKMSHEFKISIGADPSGCAVSLCLWYARDALPGTSCASCWWLKLLNDTRCRDVGLHNDLNSQQRNKQTNKARRKCIYFLT